MGPTRGAEVADAAASAARVTRAAASASAFVHAAIARAAYEAAATAARAPTDRAASAARTAFYAAASVNRAASAIDRAPLFADDEFSAAVFAAALRADARALEQGRSAADLIAAPLWPEDAPNPIVPAWAELRWRLLGLDEGWEVWTEWYDDCLNGGRLDKPLEEDRVLIDEALWKQGLKAVNAEIRRVIEEHRARAGDEEPRKEIVVPIGSAAETDTAFPVRPVKSPSTPLPAPDEAGKQSHSGYAFGGAIDGRVQLIDATQSGEARDDEIAREFHAEAREAATSLVERCERSNQLYDLGDATRRYLDRLGNGPTEVKRSLLLHGERLRNLRDANLRLQQARDPMADPIPEDAFAALQTLVAAHNQYVSTDPVLASIQRALSDPDEAGTVEVMPEEALEAVEEFASVLDETAQEALREAAEAAKPDTPAGRRARAWLANSWRNLAVETARRVLYTLRKCGEALYDDATTATELTVERAVEAAREVAGLMDERRTKAALGLGTMSQAPRVAQALSDFAVRHDAAGRAIRAAETVADGALATVGGGIGLIVLALAFKYLARWGWFLDLIENPSVRKVFEWFKP